MGLIDAVLVTIWATLASILALYALAARIGREFGVEMMAPALGVILLCISSWRLVVSSGAPAWITLALYPVAAAGTYFSGSKPDAGVFINNVVVMFIMSIGVALRPFAELLARRVLGWALKPRRRPRKPPVQQTAE